jgi:hypothetical protein
MAFESDVSSSIKEINIKAALDAQNALHNIKTMAGVSFVLNTNFCFLLSDVSARVTCRYNFKWVKVAGTSSY